MLLHRNLFADDTVPTTWLEFRLPMDEEVRVRLAKILGTELAGYLLVPDLPAGGRATALAALDAAERVEELPSMTIDGRRSDGYRITVGADRFAGVGGVEGGRAALANDVAPPIIDVWIDVDDRVRRVTVLPVRLDPAGHEPAGGWSIDYGSPVTTLDDRRPSSVSGAADVDLSQLQGRRSTGGCQVPL